jgi:heat shock protein HtpX
MTLNAFAAGTPEKAVIALTEGLRRRLNLTELAGVIAHEISHVRNNDLAIMMTADVLTRCMQWLAYLAVILAVLNIPAFLLGEAEVPLIGLVLLYLAPTAGSLIQLALSRTREYDADLEAASLTGDPRGLISALQKLDRYQGRFWEDLRLPVPGRRVPQPSLLRSHPRTEERIKRLEALMERPMLPPIDLGPDPIEPPPAPGLVAMRPRYRWTGVWF